MKALILPPSKMLGIMALIITLLPFPVSASNTAYEKFDPLLLPKLKSGKVSPFWVIMKEQAEVREAYGLSTKEAKGEFVFRKLNETASRTQSSVMPLIKARAAYYKQFWIVNAVLVHGDMQLAADLAAFPGVMAIANNPSSVIQKPVEVRTDGIARRTAAIEWGILKVNADKVWNLGFTGQGVVIGGQDTGYEWDHPAIKGKYRGWNGSSVDHNYNWHDAIHTGSGGSCGLNSPVSCDDHSHGTHTMGTMVGDDGQGNQVGMAPGAKWIGCRNMDVGNGTLDTYVECFEWFLAPTDLNDLNPMPSLAPHVINNSWGCPPSEGCDTGNFAIMDAVINNMRAAGIVVAVSAGNSGSSCSTVQDPAAIFAGSFTVGSTTFMDSISGFSSRGPVTVDGSSRIKPDVSAPGSDVRSCTPGGNYATWSGTSMAGPHVAGAVALLISARPSLAGKVDSIEMILKQTAVKLLTGQSCDGVPSSSYPNNTYGHGRIDILAAVTKALEVGINGPEREIRDVIVYPNPFSDRLVFRFSGIPSAQVSIKIFTTTGQLLFFRNLVNQKEYTADMEKLSSGLYLYCIETSEKVYYGKVAKK